MNMKLIKFFSYLGTITSITNKKIIKNNSPIEKIKEELVNFQETNIPSDLIETIQKKYSDLTYQQQINKCYFMLIISDFFLKSSYFEKIKSKYEANKKENDFYYNYYLLLFLIKSIIITDSEEILKQQYKINNLENNAKFYLDVVVLNNVSENDFEIITGFVKEQQDKDFKLTNTIVNKYNTFINKIKNKNNKKFTVEEVLLEGDYINFINLPKEFLPISNLLKKYHIWFTWQKRNVNSYEIGIITHIEKAQSNTYDEFINNLQNQLILKEIYKIINNNTNIKYKINNQLPLETLDEEILEFINK